MASTARTPRIQLVLNVRQEPQERIRKVTAAHEVVEDLCNGFVFKRPRSSVPPPPPQEPQPAASVPKSHLLKTPAAALVQQAATAVAAESPFADELEIPRALGERLLEGMQALPERPAPADRLMAFCSSICAATAEVAARRPGGAAQAAVLADAFASFQQALAGAVQEGSIRLAAPARGGSAATEDGEVEQPDYQVDLAARKAGLRARLANFQKEEAEWQALLDKVEQLDQQQLAAEAQEAEAEAVAAADSMETAGEAAGEAAAASDAQAAAGVGGSSSTELAALERLHADVHRHLAMQVEGVCKLVGDVEEMVERANRSAQAVQTEYHAEKFRVFPHVDSPARLIRELVRPPAAAGKAAAAQPPAGGKENALEAA